MSLRLSRVGYHYSILSGGRVAPCGKKYFLYAEVLTARRNSRVWEIQPTRLEGGDTLQQQHTGATHKALVHSSNDKQHQQHVHSSSSGTPERGTQEQQHTGTTHDNPRYPQQNPQQQTQQHTVPTTESTNKQQLNAAHTKAPQHQRLSLLPHPARPRPPSRPRPPVSFAHRHVGTEAIEVTRLQTTTTTTTQTWPVPVL